MTRRFYLLLILLLALSVQPGVLAQTNGKGTAAATATATAPAPLGPPVVLPKRDGSVRMLVFGDSGRGSKEQYELGRLMNEYRMSFDFDTALLTGDNIYYDDSPADMKKKFEDAYRPLLDQGVKFYASLGNHDSPNQRNYALFNMGGKEYYKLKKDHVSIYALNTTYLDKAQLDWLTKELSEDTNEWKIAFFHHPPYSSGDRHGSSKEIRAALHPLFIQHGVDVVFTGHDHFYERIKPQDGITYFVAGAGGKIRAGDIDRKTGLTDAGYDRDLSFMLVEIWRDEMHIQVIARNGTTVDAAMIKRRN